MRAAMQIRARWWFGGVAAVVAVCAFLGAPVTAGANSFQVRCASSHLATDDPIVFPGRPGAAHRHEFFGARTTSAASTATSLETGGTTCGLATDTGAYWAPSLEVNGRFARGTMTAYYQRAGKRSAAAPPRRLRIIAGNMHATSPQAMAVTNWQCVGAGREARSRVVPSCARGEQLAAWVNFPDCWDGRHLDSADHRSHLAYAQRGACPATHPVGIMRLSVRITWPVRPAGGSKLTLGDGRLPATGMHADFWNTWNQATLRQLRWDCVEVARTCGELVTRGRPRPVATSQAAPRPQAPAPDQAPVSASMAPMSGSHAGHGA